MCMHRTSSSKFVHVFEVKKFSFCNKGDVSHKLITTFTTNIFSLIFLFLSFFY